jgi:hypothetical protein
MRVFNTVITISGNNDKPSELQERIIASSPEAALSLMAAVAHDATFVITKIVIEEIPGDHPFCWRKIVGQD